MTKLEHSIRWWLRLDGTWDVTHHKQRNFQSNLFDVARDFKNFKTYEKMFAYANKLKKRIEKTGGNINDFDFDLFGFKVPGGWGSYPTTKIQKKLAKQYLK